MRLKWTHAVDCGSRFPPRKCGLREAHSPPTERRKPFFTTVYHQWKRTGVGFRCQLSQVPQMFPCRGHTRCKHAGSAPYPDHGGSELPFLNGDRRKAGGLYRLLLIGGLLLGAQACDLTGDADIQPLPPLSRPSPAARVGLPEIVGEWRFAGWDLPTADTATALGGLPMPGTLVVETQRADSLAGSYSMGPERHRIVGEVRRDSIIALVAYDPAGEGRFLAGRIRGDTLWLEFTSLAVADSWPPGTRGAFMRGVTASPFVRLPGGVLLRTEPEPVATPDTAAPAQASPGTVVPAPTRPPITSPGDTAPRPSAPPPAPVTRPRPLPDTARQAAPLDTADVPPVDTARASAYGVAPFGADESSPIHTSRASSRSTRFSASPATINSDV
jgi:hypothetical protein